MVGEITRAIAKSVRDEWGMDYRVYTESVYQNAKKPCFFIGCESAERIRLLGGGFFMRVKMRIAIENDSDTKKAEIEKMVGRLFSIINFVTVGEKKFFCRNCTGGWESSGFVVHATYDMPYVLQKDKPELMQTITFSTIAEEYGEMKNEE